MNTTIRALSIPTVLIANRDFKLPADGWVQLFPYGEVPAPIENPDGKEVPVVQVLDAQAADAVVASIQEEAKKPNFGGILVDFDHFSLDPSKESRAAMWIDEAQKRDDGCWVKQRTTNSGRTALEGGDYRFISPVLDFPAKVYRKGERVRPVGLCCAGLTNDPRIKGGVPLSNRQTAATAERSEIQPTMKTVLIKLGLADDASEQSAVAAVTTILNRATKAEGDLVTLQAEHGKLLDIQIDAALDKHKAVITNRDAWKAKLKADYKGTVELLDGITASTTAPVETTRITNRNTAKTPAEIAAEKATAEKENARAQRIANRATEIQQQKSTRGRVYPYQQAFADAERAEAAV
jgi:phage I-like protein